MKKKFTVVAVLSVVLILILCLNACTNVSSETLRNINVMLREDYSQMTVDVITQYGDESLNGKYIFTNQNDQTKVEYEYDVINKFDVNGADITAPAQFKSRVTGVAIVRDNVIETVDGEAVSNATLKRLSPQSMMFRVSCFTDVTVSSTTFHAKVNDPKSFLGDDSFDGSDMTVSVAFTDEVLTTLQINYVSVEGASVTIGYTFVK